MFNSILENGNSSEFNSRLARSSKEGRFKYTNLPKEKVQKIVEGKKRVVLNVVSLWDIATLAVEYIS